MFVKEEIWAGIPLLHISNESMDENSPTVIFLHGHMSAKEHNLHYAYQLVNKGVRVILPDAIYHGARTENLSELEMSMKFWEIVLRSVKEVGILYEEGLKLNRFLPGNVAIGGTSMGGITASASLTQYEWIKTAAICMGVTSVSKLAEHQLEAFKKQGIEMPLTDEQKVGLLQYLKTFDLENYSEIFSIKPVVFWHGMKDEIVPFHLSYPYYAEHLSNTSSLYLKEKQAAHAVSRKGILKVTEFLTQNLS